MEEFFHVGNDKYISVFGDNSVWVKEGDYLVCKDKKAFILWDKPTVAECFVWARVVS